jgi:hypothetical protein
MQGSDHPAPIQAQIDHSVVSNRPRTRAFARQQELQRRAAGSLTGTGDAPDGSDRRETPATQKNKRPSQAIEILHPEPVHDTTLRTEEPFRGRGESTHKKGAPHTSQAIRRKAVRDIASRSHSRSNANNNQAPAVSNWLKDLNTTTLDEAPTSSSQEGLLIRAHGQREDSMESSSSLSIPSTNTGDDSSTIRDLNKREKAVDWDKLRVRRISKMATEDVAFKDLKTKLISQPTKLPFKELSGLVESLEAMLQEFRKSRPSKDASSAIEEFKDQFHKWQSGHRIALMTNREFGMDVNYSMSANEAVLQRTVMVSIIDRCSFGDLFSFNCEGQWKLLPDHRLPSTRTSEHMSLPKPDLAISFRLAALTGSDPWASYPSEIAGCLRPDGSEERCFPFFFIEVKRCADNLEAAFRANLYSASQALYNIFQWMSFVELHETFWEKVRVFSMDLNAQEIKLRVHRAALTDDQLLCFYFDDVISLTNYTRDQAYQLVKSVLLDYAKSELHHILKDTFERVSKQEQLLAQQQAKNIRNKRRAPPPQSHSSSKRGRSEGRTALPPESLPTDPTTSFGASGLTI